MLMSKYCTGYDEAGNTVWKDREPKGEIHFKTDIQAALWHYGIKGQLSDGVFENDSSVDWQHWFDLDIIVDGTIGWKRYDDYIPISWRGFSSKIYDLIEPKSDLIGIAVAILSGIKIENQTYVKAFMKLITWPSFVSPDKEFTKSFGTKQEIINYVKSNISYTEEDLKKDLEVIAESMATSLRKIGYLE